MKNIITTVFIALTMTSVMNAQKSDSKNFYNAVKLTPIATFTDNYWSYGIAYERLLDTKCRFSINVPFYIAVLNEESGIDAVSRPDLMIQTNPGIYYYPIRRSNYTWAVGISGFYMRNKVYHIDYYVNPTGETEFYSIRQQKGAMLNTKVNFAIDQHFYIETEVGLGLSYKPTFTFLHTNKIYERESKEIGFVGVSLGYRF